MAYEIIPEYDTGSISSHILTASNQGFGHQKDVHSMETKISLEW